MIRRSFHFSFFMWAIVLVTLGSLSFFFSSYFSRAPERPTLSIGGKSWSVEYATTPLERERGLGFRENLCSGCAMLFVFPEAGRHSFWMRGMQFPLDIIFISEGKILSLERNIAPTDTRVLSPPSPVEFVLEVNAGEADGLLPGMTLSGLPAGF